MLIDGLPAQVSENVGQDPNHKTGPFYWTNAYADARACMAAVSAQPRKQPLLSHATQTDTTIAHSSTARTRVRTCVRF
jgi:hypothetical protein